MEIIPVGISRETFRETPRETDVYAKRKVNNDEPKISTAKRTIKAVNQGSS